jgi:polyhydroxyalkanoate synthesis regulator protein
MQGFVGSYLEQSLKLFVSQQQQVRDRVKSMVGVDPVETVTSLAQKNYARWRSVQDEIFKALMNAAGRGRDRPETEEATDGSEVKQQTPPAA